MRRVIGLDIHRVFAEAVMLDAGKIVPLGRIGMTTLDLEETKTLLDELT